MGCLGLWVSLVVLVLPGRLASQVPMAPPVWLAQVASLVLTVGLESLV
jgi:hypothetical protein